MTIYAYICISYISLINYGCCQVTYYSITGNRLGKSYSKSKTCSYSASPVNPCEHIAFTCMYAHPRQSHFSASATEQKKTPYFPYRCHIYSVAPCSNVVLHISMETQIKQLCTEWLVRLYCTQCTYAHPHVRIHTNTVHIIQPYESLWSPHLSKVKEGNSNSSRAAPQSSMIYSPCMMGHMYISYYMSWNVLDVWASPCLHTRFMS